MRYTPKEKIDSLIVKIDHHLLEIKAIMSKLFDTEKSSVVKIKLKKPKAKSK